MILQLILRLWIFDIGILVLMVLGIAETAKERFKQ